MHTPLPEQAKDKVESADEYVDVIYHYEYKCKICGWAPPQHFGCIPAITKHLLDEHGIKPSENKVFWIAGYHDKAIKKALKANPF